MEQKEDIPELPAESIEISDLEDENELSNKWLTIAVFIIWIISFLMY